jgi:hypothetical protein
MIKAQSRAARNRGDEMTDRDERLSNSSPDLRFNWLRGRPLFGASEPFATRWAKVCNPPLLSVGAKLRHFRTRCRGSQSSDVM